MDNLIRYRKADSKFRKAIKLENKNKSLEKLTANIKPTSSPNKIWRGIKSLSSGYKYNKIDFIPSSQGPIYNPQLIAENFTLTWSNDSHHSNIDPIFRTISSQIISHTSQSIPAF